MNCDWKLHRVARQNDKINNSYGFASVLYVGRMVDILAMNYAKQSYSVQRTVSLVLIIVNSLSCSIELLRDISVLIGVVGITRE